MSLDYDWGHDCVPNSVQTMARKGRAVRVALDLRSRGVRLRLDQICFQICLEPEFTGRLNFLTPRQKRKVSSDCASVRLAFR